MVWDWSSCELLNSLKGKLGRGAICPIYLLLQTEIHGEVVSVKKSKMIQRELELFQKHNALYWGGVLSITEINKPYLMKEKTKDIALVPPQTLSPAVI